MNKMMNELKKEEDKVIELEDLLKGMKDWIDYNELRREAKETMTEEQYRMYDFVLSRHEIISEYNDLIDISKYPNGNERERNIFSDLYENIDEKLFSTEELRYSNLLRFTIKVELECIIIEKNNYLDKVKNGTASEKDYDKYVEFRKGVLEHCICLFQEINEYFDEYSENDIYLNILINTRNILEKFDAFKIDNMELEDIDAKAWGMFFDECTKVNFDIDKYQKSLLKIINLASEKLLNIKGIENYF